MTLIWFHPLTCSNDSTISKGICFIEKYNYATVTKR